MQSTCLHSLRKRCLHYSEIVTLILMEMNLKRMLMDYAPILGCVLFCSSCCTYSSSAPDDKYLSDFHNKYFQYTGNESILNENDLSLFVDYSTCITLGQHSPFFQSLVPSFVAATKHYYSIKGDKIVEEQNINVFQALSNIVEVNYADLKQAANLIVNGNSEGVLLTDGEYYQKNIAGGGISDPYMANAFKQWLKKGHDIYILAEPYLEGPQKYNKKRFYFLFTDRRLEENIYKRICETTKLENYPDVEMFHLSASHPTIMAENGKSKINEIISASNKNYGLYEIQDWPVDWKTIEGYIMGAVDESTGEPLQYGNPVISGLSVDRNSYGGFRISDISIKVYDINADYYNFYTETEAPTGLNLSSISLTESVNAFVYDKEEFNKHGNINIYFDVPMWNPSFLSSKPFNFTKIDINVSDVENVFDNYEEMFNFDAIGLPGKQNTSVSESVKQALFDKDIQNMMKNANLYTIYIKSNKY